MQVPLPHACPTPTVAASMALASAVSQSHLIPTSVAISFHLFDLPTWQFSGEYELSIFQGAFRYLVGDGSLHITVVPGAVAPSQSYVDGIGFPNPTIIETAGESLVYNISLNDNWDNKIQTLSAQAVLSISLIGKAYLTQPTQCASIETNRDLGEWFHW